MMEQLLAHLFGDFIFQSDWMAQNKTKASWPCFLHCLLYSLCFLPLLWISGYVTVHEPPCITYLDGRGNETPCVSEGMHIPENANSYNVYAVRPSVNIVHRGYFRWLPWLVIFGTHFLIDRFRLARYVVWAKNLMGPWWRMETVGEAVERSYKFEIFKQRISYIAPLRDCPTGYPPTVPPWMATWLLIAADNSIHLLLNFLALKYL